ncbi:hypothetical protein B0H17DRAFT_1215832 [Mycena rosella]|uniref:Uncharacterized protein n=1 Tax=Mycena rosella TaxID=1033263 RepID=A0AAD7FVN2_MYCRO|nr:hypothetical protein B0H17DRAFT_1215832 [Mycena rosella]
MENATHLVHSAFDTTCFLKAIFHYDLFDAWPAHVDFHVVAGVLRLSQKYQVEPLKKRALVHLTERFPTTLEQFGCMEEWGVHPFLVANLAREVSADWILPPTLAACAWADPVHLVLGTHSTGARVSLAPSDAILCLNARDELTAKWTISLLDFLWTPLEISGCTTPIQCLNSRITHRQEGELFR